MLLYVISCLGQGRNGLLSYRLLPAGGQSRLFAVDSSGSVRLIRRLDRESSQRHVIVIVARDHGSPYREASASVTVTLEF